MSAHRAKALAHCLMLAAILAAATTFIPVASAELVHKERSLYQTILLTKQASIICLQFSQRHTQRKQSCFNERQPMELVLAYTKMMMSALLLNPVPSRILIIGLGGGTLPTALSELYPQAHIKVVEIDPAVVRLARRYFAFSEHDRLRVQVQDGRVFTRRMSQRDDVKYDLIMLDAFGADYIPEHLMTLEFLEETKALLSENGALAANTFSRSRLYDHESATYYEAFGPLLTLRTVGSGNRVILASRLQLPSASALKARAQTLARMLVPYGVDIRDYQERLSSKVDWDSKARLLTDQYAPANLLQGR